MKATPNFSKCPTCEKSFENHTGLILYVELESEFGDVLGTGNYFYCSETCMNAKLDTLGFGLPIHERIEIIKREQISKSPNRWRLVCKEIKLKIEMV